MVALKKAAICKSHAKHLLGAGEMGQGACSGYRKPGLLQTTTHKKSSGPVDLSDRNNNANKAMELQKIAALEEQLRQKDAEIQGLQVKYQYFSITMCHPKNVYCRKPSKRCQNSNLFKVTRVSVLPNAKRQVWS